MRFIGIFSQLVVGESVGACVGETVTEGEGAEVLAGVLVGDMEGCEVRVEGD